MPQVPDSPNLTSYMQYMHWLRNLIAAGKDITPLADNIRDTLDALWPQLTEEEQERVRKMGSAE